MTQVTSDTELVNIALRSIGSARIDSLTTGTSKEARVARDFFYHVRDRMLSNHDWNFARRRIALSRLSSTPAFGFEYAYALPPDCVRVVSVHAGDDHRQQSEYKLENIDDGGTVKRVLYSDYTTVNLVYVARIENVAIWPSYFQEAMIKDLAHHFARAIPNSQASAQTLFDEAKFELRTAKAADGIEDHADNFPPGSWVTERWVDGSGWAD